MSKSHNKSKTKKCDEPYTEKDTDSGLMYPLDFWFLLGDYIAPEDVGKFARVCSSTHLVTHSVHFWQRLYRRYCVSSDLLFTGDWLPWDLRPEHMHHTHGLRTRVIRALFYLHPVFVDRLRSQAPFQKDPNVLLGTTCILTWYEKNNANNWLFNFKFNKHKNTACPFVKAGQERSKLYQLSADDDVNENPEEGSYVLQVICQHFVSLPSVMGLVLTGTSLSVSQGMRFHKLRLHFDHTFCSSSSRSGPSVTTLLIDPVLSLHVRPWWHPNYPYSTT